MIEGSCDFMGGSPLSGKLPSVKFGGHSHSGSGVMILISRVILQGSMIKGTCDFMSRSHSWQVTTKFGMACHAHTQFIFYQSFDYYAQTNYS